MGKWIFSFLGQSSVLMPTSIVLLLAIYFQVTNQPTDILSAKLDYFQYLRLSAQAAYNSRIESQLKSVAEETRRLTAELVQARAGQPTNY